MTIRALGEYLRIWKQKISQKAVYFSVTFLRKLNEKIFRAIQRPQKQRERMLKDISEDHTRDNFIPCDEIGSIGRNCFSPET